MSAPRDWIPPWPAGDLRNGLHRKLWEEAAARFPDWDYWQLAAFVNERMDEATKRSRPC